MKSKVQMRSDYPEPKKEKGENKVKDSKESKVSKVANKVNGSLSKLADKLVTLIAFLSLFILSAYGLKQLLSTLDENVSIVVTTVVIILLSYVLFGRRNQ